MDANSGFTADPAEFVPSVNVEYLAQLMDQGQAGQVQTGDAQSLSEPFPKRLAIAWAGAAVAALALALLSTQKGR